MQPKKPHLLDLMVELSSLEKRVSDVEDKAYGQNTADAIRRARAIEEGKKKPPLTKGSAEAKLRMAQLRAKRVAKSKKKA